MAEETTVARPYAQAIFERASESSALADWSDMLQLLSAVVSDDTMAAVISGVKLGKAETAQLIIDVCGDKLNAEGANLVKLLTENGRLTVLPEITARFELLRSESESTVEAEVTSAMPVDETQQQKIAEALKQRLGKNVNLKVTIDESLIGGAVIRAGDMVIDGSASGKISKLAAAMNQ